jgi:hypothetical protein
MHVAVKTNFELSDRSHGMQVPQTNFMLRNKAFISIFMYSSFGSVVRLLECSRTSRGLAGHRENHASSAHESRAGLTI